MSILHESNEKAPEYSLSHETSKEVEVSLNDLLDNQRKLNDHDVILSPIEKSEDEVHNESTNDSTSSANDKSIVAQPPKKAAKKVFTFDVKKVFSFIQPKEKRTPVKGENKTDVTEPKPEESLSKSDEKKSKSDEKKQKSDEKKQKSEEKKAKQEEKKSKTEVVKSQFLLFGQVEHSEFSFEKCDSNILTESILESNIPKVEADPKLFDIEDESPRKQPIQVNENKSSGKKSGKEYKTVPFKSLETYKAEKDNKKTGFTNFFKSKLTRYLAFHDGSLIIGEKVKEELRIKSKTPLMRLFQVSIERDNAKKLIMLFNSQPSNISMTPSKKCYKIDNLQQFVNTLREEIEKFGSELKLQLCPNFQL